MSAQESPHFTVPQLEVPAPPPGPGVAPPFAAPPRDRDNKRLWIGLGVGGLVLVLCCVGGVFGIGLFASGSDQVVRSQATSVVTTYLDALRRENFPQAYNQLCTNITSGLSVEGFQTRVGQPRVVTFSVDAVTITQDIVVDATVQREGASSATQSFALVPSGSTLKICGGI